MIKKDKLIHIYSDKNKIIVDLDTKETFTDIVVSEDDTRIFAETDMVIIPKEKPHGTI